jgi:hypothetical protein
MPDQVCCPGNTCSTPGYECKEGKCRGKGLLPDAAITQVKTKSANTVDVTITNVGLAPIIGPCSLNAYTYLYNPRSTSSNQWELMVGCAGKQYLIPPLGPGQSVTLQGVCGYSAESVNPGFKSIMFIGYQCGGETNDKNNHFEVSKEPDADFYKSYRN